MKTTSKRKKEKENLVGDWESVFVREINRQRERNKEKEIYIEREKCHAYIKRWFVNT